MTRQNNIANKLKNKVLIVDDHPIVCNGLAELINQQNDFDVCGTANNDIEAMTAIRENDPDVAIVDITLGDKNGLRLIEDISESYPDLRMLTLSMHDESIYAERCLRAGARGYVMKHEPPNKIVKAMRAIIAGDIYISGLVGKQMLNKFVKKESGAYTSPTDPLSNRELEIFEMIGKGTKTRDIADQLCLSVKTVESYMNRIKTKMNYKDSRKLFLHAVQWLMSENKLD